MEQENTFVMRFAESLVKNNFMKEEEADSFVKEFKDRAKGNVVSFLLEEGLLQREDVLKSLGTVYDIPSFDVRGHFFNHQLLLLFPKDFLLETACIPLGLEDDILTIVMNNPEDEEAIESFGEYVTYKINVQVGIQEDILDAVKEYYDEDIITSEMEEQQEESEEEVDDSDEADFL